MSLAVKHLNADATFLLTLRPDQGDLIYQGSKSPPAFTILIDPWLNGRTVIGHRWFASAEHSIPPCINHLSQLDQEPDLVIISQAKPDHCHEPTLRQLARDSSKTTIVAEPKAAKVIGKFKHFHHAKIVSAPEYNSKRPESVLRFRIEPLTEKGEAGEVTVALLPARDTAGIHNAIGITYQAPTAGLCLGSLSTANLLLLDHFKREVFSPAVGLSEEPKGGCQHVALASTPPLPLRLPIPTPNPNSSTKSRSRIISKLPIAQRPGLYSSPSRAVSQNAATPELANLISASAPSFPESQHLASVMRAAPLSILYSPHGISSSSSLDRYASEHLQIHTNNPDSQTLTLLIHSFDRVQSPWYLGGNIVAGANGGGVALAIKLRAKLWVGAHDEEKITSGVIVNFLKTEREMAANISRMVRDGGGVECDVRDLEVGEEVVLRE
ncbi:hypothetical protein ACJ72_07007 [Emergomyces africanus]|uniref:Uncharacterized protein n=1 Tax=Emergomyces africanus TaxID=1955775 RepID=A0A1B7NPE1_9EURO|nr:hypothetical protein ACJ72_07007 [Emergomyces africanus]